MANNNKKYWWLKLKADFFTNTRIKKVRRVAGGDTYVLIYLKMQLLSLKNDGELYFEGVEDNMIDEIALEIDEDAENVAVTVMYLIKNELIEEVDKETYSLTETKECIGSETAGASRVRKHREIKSNKKLLQCNTDVTKCNTEIEKELDTEKELDIEITTTIKEIVDYLNETQAAEYTTLVETAMTAFKAAKDESKKKKPEEMSQVELEAYIAALQAGTKYTPASAPKSFLDMLSEVDYARYNELLGIAAEVKANTPKAPRQPMTEAQKAQRAVKRQKTELSKAQALLESLKAASAAYQVGQAETVGSVPSAEDEDYIDSDDKE